LRFVNFLINENDDDDDDGKGVDGLFEKVIFRTAFKGVDSW